jgi:hypothetical protein
MKLLIIFLLLTSTTFAKDSVTISEIGDLIQNEMSKSTLLETSEDCFEISEITFEVEAEVGVTIPGLASVAIEPIIKFYFEK